MKYRGLIDVEAHQLPERGDFEVDEVIEWLDRKEIISFESSRDESLYVLPENGVEFYAEPGEWIVIAPYGHVYALPDEEFKKYFKLESSEVS